MGVVVRWCVWPCARRRRRCCRRTAAPTATTSRPEIRFSHGYSVSGSTYCESASVIAPSANTPAVCVTVTIAPSTTACRGLPRVPTRYAATIALPWPGESACTAPQPKAATSSRSKHALARRGVAEDLRQALHRLARTACRRSSAHRRAPSACPPRARRPGARCGRPAGSSAGRAGSVRSPSVGSPDGTLDFTAVPRPGAATIAFQPTRPGNVPSRSSTRRGSDTGAESGISTRVVRSPPWPGGCEIVARPAGRSATAARPRSPPAARSTSVRLRASSAGSGRLALLEGRDLGLVEDVANVDAIRRDADPRQVVDREVAERVRRRDGRCERQRAHGQACSADRGCTHVGAPWESPLFSPSCAARASAVLRLLATGSQLLA